MTCDGSRVCMCSIYDSECSESYDELLDSNARCDSKKKRRLNLGIADITRDCIHATITQNNNGKFWCGLHFYLQMFITSNTLM